MDVKVNYQEKLEYLLDKYAVVAEAVMDSPDMVTIDGKEYPILSHRFERRITELKKMAGDGTLTGISAMRCGNVSHRDVPLDSIIKREADICRFVLADDIVSVTAFKNRDSAATVIAETSKGIVCSMELADTLPCDANPVDKHEIISARGFICDRVVDTQIPQQSVYLYSDTQESYTDVDFELYGLSMSDTAAVRAAFAMAKDEKLREDSLSENDRLEKIAAAVNESAESGHRVFI